MPIASDLQPSIQFIIGLTGDRKNNKYFREIEIQIALTEAMIKNQNSKIPGLEHLRPDKRDSLYRFSLDSELKLEEMQEDQQDIKKDGIKKVVLHICGHHTPRKPESQDNQFGFRIAHKNGFYKTHEITATLVSFLNTFPDLQDLHVVLHSCKTATSINPNDEAFTGSTMRDIISSLESQLQQESMEISIYGVEHKMNQSRKGYQLWLQKNSKSGIEEVKNPTFKNIVATLTKQEEDELPADLPSTPEKSSEAGDQGDSPSSRAGWPTTKKNRSGFEKK